VGKLKQYFKELGVDWNGLAIILGTTCVSLGVAYIVGNKQLIPIRMITNIVKTPAGDIIVGFSKGDALLITKEFILN
jgi:hypothetical protein